MSVLEIVFVGQREVFVCLDFVHFFPPLATKLIGQQTGCQFYKICLIFPTPTPLSRFSESSSRKAAALYS